MAILSALFSALLLEAHLPAALLLGAIIAGILVETGQAEIHVPKLPFNIAQGVIGCLVAKALTLEIIHAFMQSWPVFLVIVFIIIASSCFLGWAISKLGILPGTTAIWGLLPGAASVMMLMSESFGADGRLVAFMQYFRVVLVAVIASIIAHFWVDASVTTAGVIWFPIIHWLPFIETLVIILGGVGIGYVWKLPAGMLLIPLFAGSALQLGGLVDIEIPGWLLAAGYLCIGWQIGLRFTRSVLVHAARALPQIFVSILAVIMFCGGLAYILTRLLGIDLLTAYLATSPGGVDAVAIIAASANVNVGFVMTLQLSRALLVIFVGPALSRFFSDQLTKK
ncbi:MAG: AbrB family transcriptional regulator [Methylococcales bacterium]|nr:AbrB family transcriptional regulator [Methylococcales bacterium]